jgi:hypothetical protein
MTPNISTFPADADSILVSQKPGQVTGHIPPVARGDKIAFGLKKGKARERHDQNKPTQFFSYYGLRRGGRPPGSAKQGKRCS